MPPRPRARRRYRSEARRSPAVAKAAARLGQRVRELRTTREFSQEGLADRAKLDAKHVQAVEVGRTNVTLATLVALAKALGVRIADLLEGV